MGGRRGRQEGECSKNVIKPCSFSLVCFGSPLVDRLLSVCVWEEAGEGTCVIIKSVSLAYCPYISASQISKSVQAPGVTEVAYGYVTIA